MNMEGFRVDRESAGEEDSATGGRGVPGRPGAP